MKKTIQTFDCGQTILVVYSEAESIKTRFRLTERAAQVLRDQLASVLRPRLPLPQHPK